MAEAKIYIPARLRFALHKTRVSKICMVRCDIALAAGFTPSVSPRARFSERSLLKISRYTRKFRRKMSMQDSQILKQPTIKIIR